MPAGAECDCTAQLLRSIRALHILHRNAQRPKATRRTTPFDDLTYLWVVVVVLEVEVVVLVVVVVVGVESCALSLTGPTGWATR